jgi:hypothetical protein
MTSPFVPSGFIAGFITDGIGGLRGEGWRWGVSDTGPTRVMLMSVRHVCHLDPDTDGPGDCRHVLGPAKGEEPGSSRNR